MKTFRELISWELEQDKKQKRSLLGVSGEESAGRMSASVMRKLKYLNSGAASSAKSFPESFGST